MSSVRSEGVWPQHIRTRSFIVHFICIQVIVCGLFVFITLFVVFVSLILWHFLPLSLSLSRSPNWICVPLCVPFFVPFVSVVPIEISWLCDNQKHFYIPYFRYLFQRAIGKVHIRKINLIQVHRCAKADKWINCKSISVKDRLWFDVCGLKTTAPSNRKPIRFY